ncbi:MAG: ATP-dependent Clp protease ATP-binding subunit [Alistipes sp.]|nr:ATP-dependent Clp protease ATP-binding subunit [Alistipes sp.]
MQIKISKTLEGIIAGVVFDTAKAGHSRALKDYLALSIIRSEGSLAHQVVAARLKDWELYQMTLRIEREAASEHDMKVAPEEFFGTFIEELRSANPNVQTISTIHALVAIADDKSTCTSRVMEMYRLAPETLAADAEHLAEGGRIGNNIEPRRLDYNEARTEKSLEEAISQSSSLLLKFGTDLTRLAREGAIDPVIGRNDEIERVVQILSRRKKNNPVLIGEAGVGKSAIVEGLALRIVSGEVPYTLASKRLFALDVTSLVAGTKFRGEFEERMQQLLTELRKAKDTIIFIDEIHTIVGAGASQGSLDTANILKPALARGELQVIGATTLDEYRENIERDAALERRFQRVMVEPTTREQTLQILRNVAPHYEQYHNVRYSEAALDACIALADRYITDRHFPDKALDILDEAGSRARISSARVPAEIRTLEKALTEARNERREAVEALVYEQAAVARMREIALRSKISESRAEWHRSLVANPITVDDGDIARVITSMTGIPIERIAGDELERVKSLRTTLTTRIIGQAEAVERVTRSIHRSRAGLKDERRPIGVFMFVGPTGVGKTLLAKELSRHLFDERRGLIRIDMSEYSEKHNIARLIGSPPGYVGYGEGGQLTEAVRRHPYSVILLDEIEKAHPDTYNTMLQIFDEGHLTDGSGRRVDFRNTIIIMTSNVGSQDNPTRPVRVGYATSSGISEEAVTPQQNYRKALERTFAPEFINRVDDVVVFRSLELSDVERIIELELQDIVARAKRMGYTIEITPEAKHTLAEQGYDERYGARALKRTLTEEVEEPLSTLVIEGRLRKGDTVVVEQTEQGVTLNVA